MSIFSDFFKKEAPLLGLQGSGGGLGFLAGGGADPIDASGGTKTFSGEYTIHTFLRSAGATQNFTVASGSGYIDWLVIGGGGGGGGDGLGSASGQGRCSSGGGAGGYRTSMPEGPGGPNPSAEPQLLVDGPAQYEIVIGGGGTGSDASGSGNQTPGGFSRLGHPTTIRSEGGGAGTGANNPGIRFDGGSGGGGSAFASGSLAGGRGNRVGGQHPTSPAPNQGYDGGTGYGFSPENSGSAGGGGGAGAVGADGHPNTTQSNQGYGGIGKISSITGSNVKRAGGGSAGWTPEPLHNANGGDYGSGGGGYGPGSSPQDRRNGDAATANTGSGGGGGGATSPYTNYVGGGNGADGIVIIRYLT